ncbi:MAG: formylglycine-generating enzyme family protein [Lewinellaceae bacterium]|nr:formylglycine-generating enzyme family protein [Lewinellaceae bacterium]
MELEADTFSGSALRMLGAPLDDAKAGIELFAPEGETKTHPPGSARREAVASGWKKQDEHLRSLGVIPPAKRAGPNSKQEPISTAGMLSGEVAADGLVFVEGGTFSMGCTKEQGKYCSDDESPVRQVTLSDFFIAQYEVTQRQWRDVMGNNPSENKYCDDCPVENVSWNDVQEFLKKLNAANPGKNYRLPTEAEWGMRRAAADGARRTHAGSNKISRVAWYRSNSDGKSHPVGGKMANELELYDMSGNVWEWCSDWFGTYSFRAETNPKGGGEGDYRVIRGGSCYDDARDCRVAGRGYGEPADSFVHLGFRLCRSF